MYATTRDSFEQATREFVLSASQWGLTVSIAKTKGMVVGKQMEDSDVSPVQGEGEIVENFTYLGSNITSDGELLE